MPDHLATQTSTLVTGGSPARGAVVYVKVWVPGETAEPGGSFQAGCAPAICLAADLIAASGGTPEETSGEILVARYPALQSSILAARRLQWAAQGFSETDNPKKTAVAVLVQHGEDPLGPIEDTAFPPVLQYAQPGQILLTESAGKLLSDLAGFSLGPASDGGFRELLWRRPDDQTTASSDKKTIAWLIEQKAPGTYREDEAAGPASENSPGAEDTHRDSQPGLERAARGSFSPDATPRRGKMPWLIGGAAAAILLLAAVPVFHLFGGKEAASHNAVAEGPPVLNSAPTGPSQASPAARRNPAAPLESSPAAAAHKAQQPQPIQPQDQPRDKKDRSNGKEEQAKSKEAAQKLPEPPKSKCDLDHNQLGGQLEQAENSLARGKYKDALRQFDSVLACEPGNARAQEGVTRVHQAQMAEGSGSRN